MIPRADVLLAWNVTDDERMAVCDVAVLDLRTLPQGEWVQRTHTSGGCIATWGERGFTPEAQFAVWAAEGFADTNAVHKALFELCDVEGCEWALAALKLMDVEGAAP